MTVAIPTKTAPSDTPSATRRTYAVLGGRRTLRGGEESLADLQERIRRGLPYGALEAAMAALELSREQAAELLHVPLRTLSRRKRQHRLEPEESDRLVRLARVAGQAITVLGSGETASRWLRRPNRALGGAVPLELLDTDPGARRVEQELGRIEHGVMS
jgi:putative toxin-antitoxin system antitoxin component (TIGR02293 family)